MVPIVSVLMTAYNREKYIGEAIESVLASTYQDWELIIVDDQSKDNTVEIARTYEKTDPRIRVSVNERNLGDYPNRNRAASYARGKYLKYLDADDTIYPWGLGLLVQMMEQYPEAGWGLCSLEQNITRPFPILLTPREAYEYNYIGPGLFHKAPLSSIFKKSVFDEIGGFRPMRMIGDFDMWHRLAQKYSVVLMPHGIVWSRVHGDQEMNDYLHYRPSYERVRVNYLRDRHCPLDASQAKNLLKQGKQIALKRVIKSLIRMRFKSVKIFINCLKVYFE